MTNNPDPHNPEMKRLSTDTMTPTRWTELVDEARERCPVAHSDELGGHYVLLDYATVKAGMANHGVFSSEPSVLRPLLPREQTPALEMDPPRHANWRVLYDQAVTPHSVAVMEPVVREDISRRIDSFIETGHAEIVEDIADTVPADTICRLVGIDEDMVPTVRRLAVEMFASTGDPEEYGRRQAAFAEVTVGEVHRRRSEPRDDYLTYLANVEVEGRLLEDNDLVGLMVAFLAAGHHSTTSAMTSLVFEVFSNPDVRDRLLADPSLIPVAIEETLRLNPPFYGFFRRAAETSEVAGVKIDAGDDVFMAWASANRDEQQFTDATRFSLDRGRNRHLSFGFGVHTCPGAPLARMELRVMLEELLRRTPDLTIDVAEPEVRFVGVNGASITSLPVSFTPGTPEGGSAR